MTTAAAGERTHVDCCGARFFAGEHCDACGKTVPAPTPFGATYVAVYTDSMGTWQARCLSCPWRGPWRRTQAKTVEDGRGHVHG